MFKDYSTNEEYVDQTIIEFNKQKLEVSKYFSIFLNYVLSF